jgi:hypothetical protein
MTTWRPNEPVEENTLNLAGIDHTADLAAARGMTGLLTKPSLGLSKLFGPTERSSEPLLAVLILDPRSSLR